MIVVSNSGPLIHLTRLSLLYLLKKLFGMIFITRKIYDETVVAGKRRGYTDANIIEKAIDDWIIVIPHKVSHDFKLKAISFGLDEGEIEAISLAKYLGAMLLIDDKKGRIFAESIGLRITGTLGIIIMSAKKRLISKGTAKSKLMLLPKIMHISQDLINKAILEVNDV